MGAIFGHTVGSMVRPLYAPGGGGAGINEGAGRQRTPTQELHHRFPSCHDKFAPSCGTSLQPCCARPPCACVVLSCVVLSLPSLSLSSRICGNVTATRHTTKPHTDPLTWAYPHSGTARIPSSHRLDTPAPMRRCGGLVMQRCVVLIPHMRADPCERILITAVVKTVRALALSMSSGFFPPKPTVNAVRWHSVRGIADFDENDAGGIYMQTPVTPPEQTSLIPIHISRLRQHTRQLAAPTDAFAVQQPNSVEVFGSLEPSSLGLLKIRAADLESESWRPRKLRSSSPNKSPRRSFEREIDRERMLVLRRHLIWSRRRGLPTLSTFALRHG